MAKRSPILGFNHNIRHRGVVFHVQTEDSGVDNPHLFTHLFHGGTILSTRKLDYDRDSDEDVVKGLMQSQHKAILKELKSGAFDAKITLYLGDNPELRPSSAALASAEASAGAEGSASAEALAPTTQPNLSDSSSTQEMPVVRRASDTASPVALVEERTDATIRIEIEPEPGDLTPPPGFAVPEVLLPDGRSTDLGIPRANVESAAPPVAAIAPAATAAVAAPPARPAPGSQTIGFGSAMLGAAVRASEQAAAAAEPARARRVPPPPPGARPPVSDRPQPGSVEFRPPTGEFKRVPGAAAPAADLSAALRAMSDSEASQDDTTSPSAPPPGRLGQAIAAQAVDNSVYIHTRGGRHSIDPANADDPSQPADAIPPRPSSVTAVRAAVTTAEPKGKGGGVIASRPSVIVGAPSKVVGGAAVAPAPVAASPGTGRGVPRRAREGGRPGLFGKDLISEKSLDEVILAYLSEDGDDKK